MPLVCKKEEIVSKPHLEPILFSDRSKIFFQKLYFNKTEKKDKRNNVAQEKPDIQSWLHSWRTDPRQADLSVNLP